MGMGGGGAGAAPAGGGGGVGGGGGARRGGAGQSGTKGGRAAGRYVCSLVSSVIFQTLTNNDRALVRLSACVTLCRCCTTSRAAVKVHASARVQVCACDSNMNDVVSTIKVARHQAFLWQGDVMQCKSTAALHASAPPHTQWHEHINGPSQRSSRADARSPYPAVTHPECARRAGAARPPAPPPLPPPTHTPGRPAARACSPGWRARPSPRRALGSTSRRPRCCA